MVVSNGVVGDVPFGHVLGLTQLLGRKQTVEETRLPDADILGSYTTISSISTARGRK